MIYTILFNDADPSFSQQRREGHDLCSVFTIIMYVGHTKSHSTVMKIEISVEKGVYSKRPYQFLNCSQLGSQPREVVNAPNNVTPSRLRLAAKTENWLTPKIFIW
jgi:hypothetical protein